MRFTCRVRTYQCQEWNWLVIAAWITPPLDEQSLSKLTSMSLIHTNVKLCSLTISGSLIRVSNKNTLYSTTTKTPSTQLNGVPAAKKQLTRCKLKRGKDVQTWSPAPWNRYLNVNCASYMQLTKLWSVSLFVFSFFIFSFSISCKHVMH